MLVRLALNFFSFSVTESKDTAFSYQLSVFFFFSSVSVKRVVLLVSMALLFLSYLGTGLASACLAYKKTLWCPVSGWLIRYAV